MEKAPRILIVDDEPEITAACQSFFSRRGYLVNTTGSGRDALAMIRASKPDLIFLDLALHELDGREVLKALRKTDQRTKVIIITGHTLNSDKQKKMLLASGADAYLIKPVDLKGLDKIVRSMLGLPEEPPAPSPVRSRKSSLSHRLSNLLGIIKNKCENFTLSIEDGVYKDKTDKELVSMSVEIMNDIITTVDRVTEEG